MLREISDLAGKSSIGAQPTSSGTKSSWGDRCIARPDR